MIQIKDLSKRFGKNQVLKGIDLEINKRGAVSAILGPNGSGKTTLIKTILGMVLPDEGTVRVAGEDVRGQWSYRDRISYLPQIARFPDNLRLRELFAMVKDLRKRPARDEALIRLFELEPHLDKPLSTLSGGTRQKANLVLALMYDNPLLILDEPTAGLDPVAIIRLKDLLAEEVARGKIVLITTHIMSLVEELADEVIFLLDGRIHFRGGLEELRSRYGETSVERAIARLLEGNHSRFSQNGVPPKVPAVK